MSSKKTKLLESAQKNFLKGLYDKAISEYRDIIQLDPADVRHRQRLAEILTKANKNEEAIKEYTALAKIYIDSVHYLKAIAVYKQIQKIDPTNPDISLTLASLNEKQGLLGNATAEYASAVQIFESKKDHFKALKALESMLAIDPGNLAVRLRVAEKYFTVGKEDQAADEFAALANELQARDDANGFQLVSAKIRQIFKEKAADVYARINKEEEPETAEAPQTSAQAPDLKQPPAQAPPAAPQKPAAPSVSATPPEPARTPASSEPPGSATVVPAELQMAEPSPEHLLTEEAADEIELLEELELIEEIEELESLPSAAEEAEWEEEIDLDALAQSTAGHGEFSSGSEIETPLEIEELEELELEGEFPLETGELEEQELGTDGDFPLESEETGELELDLGGGFPLDTGELQEQEFELEGEFPLETGELELEGDFPLETAELEEQELDLESGFPQATGVTEETEPEKESEFPLETVELEDLEFELEIEEPVQATDSSLPPEEPQPEPAAAESGKSDLFDLGKELSGFADEIDFDILGTDKGDSSGFDLESMTGFKKNELDNEDAESHYSLGLAYKEMGLFDEAINEFVVASNSPERQIDCQVLQGACLREKGEPGRAVEHLEVILEQPGLSEIEVLCVKYELAICHETVGYTKLAKQLYNEILAVRPDFSDTASRLKALK